ncbi:MAG: LacI family DNA-binding transcriptional regulator [Pseudomonadota bacterium]|nr:LacI family DNA-binding transcriptional regulator [Pseudomonadota bacterium]
MANGNNPKITLEDLAKLAGVSVSTVSRALNDFPSISDKTKQRIWRLARDHDYPLRFSLPDQRKGSEGSIVVVLPFVKGRPLPLSHPFFLEMLASIGEVARARNYEFTVSPIAPAVYDDLLLASATARPAKGLIFLGQGSLHKAFNDLADTPARFVVWGAQLPNQKYRTIGSNNLLGGKRATSHLARLGRKSIVFLGGHDPESIQRRRGYHEALKENGLNADPRLVADVEFELDAADAAISQMLRRGIEFDAVFSSSDLMALGAIRAIRRAGMSVPQDVSIVGYDDMLLSRISTPTLTTIRQDTYEAGRLLVSSILDPIREGHSEVLTTELIVRESCGG